MTKRLAFLVLGVAFALGGSSARAASSDSTRRAVVFVSAVHAHPDLSAPWQRQRPHSITGSGAIIAGNLVLTNAHVVEDAAMLEVRREAASRSYTAKVRFVSHDIDLALLEVPDPAFFEGVTPLAIGGLPELRSEVGVYGFPEGGTAVSITSGVVSRIEVAEYVHSRLAFLRAQIDAAINPGNSGGPVVGADRKIVGVAMQVRQGAENIGYMVPAPVISQFLRDVEDSRLDGVPSLGVWTQTLENPSMRKALGLADGVGGVLVVGVHPKGSAQGRVKVGDVLLSCDGRSIERDGLIEFDDGLRVAADVLEQSKQVGEPLALELIRDGARRKEKVALGAPDWYLRTRTEDGKPTYFVYGGLIFAPLSEQWARSLRGVPGYTWLYLQEFTYGRVQSLVAPEGRGERRESVAIVDVLADDVNRGYAWMRNATVWSVDGVPVNDFADLVARIESGQDPYVRIVTENGGLVVLERAAVAERERLVLDRYGLAHDRSTDLLPASPAPE